MTDFLDKLAMEVSEWGKGSTKDPMRWVALHPPEDGEIRKSPLGWLAFNEDGDKVLVRQWIQRRKELINEPDDADAPEWVEWKAQDSDGRWSWYEAKPTISSTHWNYSDGSDADDACQGKIPAGHDWRDTLKEVNHEARIPDSYGFSFDIDRLFIETMEAGRECVDDSEIEKKQPQHIKTILKLIEALNDCIDDEVSDHLRKTIIRLLDKL